MTKSIGNMADEFGFEFAIVDMRQMMREIHGNSGNIMSMLSPKERIIFEGFSMPKKRVQWLSGRITAKTILLKMENLIEADLWRIDVLSREDGAPYILQYPDFSLSITHSFPYCIAAISKQKIGIDLEKVVPLRRSLVEMYFHSCEILELDRVKEGEEVDRQAIAYWTRKEAVSKLIGLGMKIGFKNLNTVEARMRLEEYALETVCLKTVFCDNLCFSVAADHSPPAKPAIYQG